MSPTTDLLLRGCAVVDATRDEPLTGVSVLVEGGRITEIGADAGRGADVPTVDLDGGYVVPGLWDVHCHLSLMIPDPTAHSRFDSVAEATLRAGHNAIDALHVGFTSLRVVGEVDGIDFAWRDAFRAGTWPGPRMFCAGHLLSTTGGHLRQSRLAPLRVSQLTSTFDGSADALRVTRDQIHRGADLIKIAVTGGMGLHEAPDERQMLPDEIDAVLAAARAKGRPVAAHASGGDATKDALRAGIASVEHGYVLDEECIALMAEHGTTFVPTLGVTHDDDYAQRHHWPTAIVDKSATMRRQHHEALQMAMSAGVRICSGGDRYPIADSGVGEIEVLARAGLGERGALRAATIDAAALCGVDDQLGTVEVGKIADLVVLGANVLDDVSAIRDVRMVVKGGRVLVDRRQPRLDERAIGAGVSVLGVPLAPLPPDLVVHRCC